MSIHESWGRWGSEPPCEHLLELRNQLIKLDIGIHGEHSEQPHGWVNVHCGACGRTYETTLRPNEQGVWTNEDEPEEEG